MGLPEIIIAFKAKGVSAITRSARGTVLLLFKSAAHPTGAVYPYTDSDAVSTANHDAAESAMIKSCFAYHAAKVICVYMVLKNGTADIESTNILIGKERFHWLCPCTTDYSNAALKSLITALRLEGRNIKAVTSAPDAPNHEAIVHMETADLTMNGVSGTGLMLCPIVASMLANLPLGESITYCRIPEITAYSTITEPGASIDMGKLTLIKDDAGFKIARGITSLTTLSPGQSAELKKIKIVDAIDTIRADIKSALEQNYIGRVRNDYDAKLLLAGAIQGYFEGLGQSVLDKSYENKVQISLSGQRQYLLSHGIDVSAMTETELLKANTGSAVFLEANVRFVDAMEDISFTLSM